MKKAFLLLLVWVLSSLTALRADVATPHPLRMQQPDGSTITLRLHGDEFHHWYTDLDGHPYIQDEAGWWRRSFQPAVTARQHQAARRLRQMRDERFIQRTKSRSGLGLGWGSNHFLVILVEWSDKSFQGGAASYFDRMLNAAGFNDNGAVGSARDYWSDASGGRFTPSFDVYGPVRLERKHDEFPSGDGDEHYEMARTMLEEALAQLDAGSDIDFSLYDNDNDGYIDNVYMFYPGYAQSNGGGKNTIWPHAWALRGNKTYDGVRAGSYACSSELNGRDGTVFNGCGTFCHEFGHVIGLPDLYDTDYEDNGEALHPGAWNLMAGGNHNGSGRIPAALSSYERYILGYLENFEDLSAAGDYTLPAVTSNRAFMLPTANAGEKFILEVRDGSKWDSPLPSGLIIYHSDASDNLVNGVSARRRWDSWDDINCFAKHPCHYIIPPVDDAEHRSYEVLWVLPKDRYNRHDIKETRPAAWSGLSPYVIREINYSGGQVSLRVGPGVRQLAGKVQSTRANGTATLIAGATVLVLPAAEAAPPTRSGLLALQRAGHGLPLAEARQKALYETQTDADGRYLLSLAEADPARLTVAVYATDYLPAESLVSGHSVQQDFALTPLVSGLEDHFLTKAKLPISSYSSFGIKGKTGTSYALGHKYSARELEPYAGHTMAAVQFSTGATGQEIYVIVEVNGTRVLTRRVTKVSNDVVGKDGLLANVIDISDANIVVPADAEVVVGYMVKNCPEEYYMTVDTGPGQTGGFLIGTVDMEKAVGDWLDYVSESGFNNNLLIGLAFRAISTFDDRATLSDMGFSYIELPATPLVAGAVFPLKLVSSVSNKPVSVNWYCDDARVDGDSVTLSAGTHIIQARLQYKDGSSDVVELRLDIQ